MNSVGDLCVVGCWAGGVTDDVALMRSNDGGVTFGAATKTGLPNVLIKGLACYGSTTFLLSNPNINTIDLFFCQNIASGSWGTVAADFTGVTLGEKPNYTVSEDGFIQLIQREEDGYEYFISEDRGLSWDAVVMQASGVDSFGVKFTAKVIGITLQRDGDLIYSVQKETVDGTVFEYRRTDNHDADWVVADYVPEVTSSNSSDITLNATATTLAIANIMNTQGTAISIINKYVTGSISTAKGFTLGIRNGERQLPFINGAKIVAED